VKFWSYPRCTVYVKRLSLFFLSSSNNEFSLIQWFYLDVTFLSLESRASLFHPCHGSISSFNQNRNASLTPSTPPRCSCLPPVASIYLNLVIIWYISVEGERIILKFLSIQIISSISLILFFFSLTFLQHNTSLFIILDMTLKIRNKNI
jgi:hypothetical protein